MNGVSVIARNLPSNMKMSPPHGDSSPGIEFEPGSTP